MLFKIGNLIAVISLD